MFSLVTGLYDSYLANPQIHVLVVGASGVGKTALLERLKVTQVAKRPKATIVPMIPVPPCIAIELEKGGVVLPNRAKWFEEASSLARNRNGNNHRKKQTTIPSHANIVSAASPSPAPIVVTQKRRFQFCPAPERYSKKTEDQDEEYVEDDEEEDDDDEYDDIADQNGNQRPAPPMKVLNNNEDEGVMPLAESSTTEAPMRVRLHSKEFLMDSLDLDNELMDDVELSPKPKPSSSPQRPAGMPSTTAASGKPKPAAGSKTTRTRSSPSSSYPYGISLQQESSQEVHLKPNAKMLPLDRIRPTSTYIHIISIGCHSLVLLGGWSAFTHHHHSLTHSFFV